MSDQDLPPAGMMPGFPEADEARKWQEIDPGHLAWRRDRLHDPAGSRPLQPRPHPVDRAQDDPQVFRRQGPPLLPAPSLAVHNPHRRAGHQPTTGLPAVHRRGLLQLFPAQRATRAVDQPPPVGKVTPRSIVHLTGPGLGPPPPAVSPTLCALLPAVPLLTTRVLLGASAGPTV